MTAPTVGPEKVARRPGALRSGAVGAAASTIIAVASTAPAYSLAVTIAVLVAAPTVTGLAALAVGALVMLVVLASFEQLNRRDPDCGTVYTWVTRAFGPVSGLMAVVCSMAASIIVCASLVDVAVLYTGPALGLGSPDGAGAGERGLRIVAGLLLLVVLAAAVNRGIRFAARLQTVLLALEVVVLALFAVGALLVEPASPSTPASAADGDTFWPLLLVTVFLYWGWDSSYSLNEESVRPRRTPGRAAAATVVAVALGYVLFLLAVGPAVRPVLDDVGDGDVLAVLARPVLGPVGEPIVALAVVVSCLAAAATTLIPSARSLYAVARAGTRPPAGDEPAPRWFATVASTNRAEAPAVATWMVAGLSGAVLVVALVIAQGAIDVAVGAIAILVAAYYLLTCAAACAGAVRERAVGAALVALVGALGLVVLLALTVRDTAAVSLTALAAALVLAVMAALARLGAPSVAGSEV